MNFSDDNALNIKWVALHSLLFFALTVTAQLFGAIALESAGLGSLARYSYVFGLGMAFLFLAWISFFQAAGWKHLAGIYAIQALVTLASTLIDGRSFTEFSLASLVYAILFAAAKWSASVAEAIKKGELREYLTEATQSILGFMALQLYLVVPSSIFYWIYLGVQIGSFLMVIIGLLPIFWIFTIPLAFWSFWFGMPQWLENFFS